MTLLPLMIIIYSSQSIGENIMKECAKCGKKSQCMLHVKIARLKFVPAILMVFQLNVPNVMNKEWN